MTYHVEIGPRAADDIRHAYRWLLERAPEAAVRWYDGLSEAIQSLESNPERCPLAPEGTFFNKKIHQLLYGHRPSIYRVLFLVTAQRVHVLRVRHGAQQYLLATDLNDDERSE